MNENPNEEISPFQIKFPTLVQATSADPKIVVVPTPTAKTGQTKKRVDLDMNDSTMGGGAIIKRLITFTSTDATPSVKNANLCITAGTTAITDFDDGVVGQVIMIKATANITITNDAAIIKLAGAANYAMTADDTLTLAMFDDQIWHEICRSVN